MKTAEQVRADLKHLEVQIEPLNALRLKLSRELSKLESEEFIRVNKITKDDVEMSSGAEMQYFGHITEFIRWLKANPSYRRFAEWNGRIYFMSDLLNGFMPETPGLVDDLPK